MSAQHVGSSLVALPGAYAHPPSGFRLARRN